MTDIPLLAFDQAVEYLDSYEADGYCRITGFDTYANTIWIESYEPAFHPIIEAYIHSTWGIAVRIR